MSKKVTYIEEYTSEAEEKDAAAISFAGVASILVGTVGLFGGAYTGIFAMEILGAMIGVAGGFQFVQIFNRTSWGKRFGSMILSALYILCGFFIAATPVSSASAATLLLGFLFLSSGVVKAIITAEAKFGGGKVWLYTSSVLSICLGLFIVTSWPVNSVELLGFMVSAELMMTGATFISLGSILRQDASEKRKLPSAPVEEFTAEEQAIETKEEASEKSKKAA